MVLVLIQQALEAVVGQEAQARQELLTQVVQAGLALLMPMTEHQRPMRLAVVVLAQLQAVQVSRMFQAMVLLVQAQQHLVRLIVVAVVVVRQVVRLVLAAQVW